MGALPRSPVSNEEGEGEKKKKRVPNGPATPKLDTSRLRVATVIAHAVDAAIDQHKLQSGKRKGDARGLVEQRGAPLRLLRRVCESIQRKAHCEVRTEAQRSAAEQSARTLQP